MDIFIIVALNIAAIIFFILEVFVFPGMTISAIAALICMSYSIYYAFDNLGDTAGYTTWIASGAISLTAIFLFVRWRRIDKVALQENINSTVDKTAERSIKVGDTGESITRLALYGRAIINDKNIEVRSAEGLIEENTPLIVTTVSNTEVIVKKLK